MPIFIDLECFFLLGLHYCQDSIMRKMQFYYSILISGQKRSQPGSFETNPSDEKNKKKKIHKKSLDLMDGHIEIIMYKQCVLTSLFIEYHALPAKAGKSEFIMLQMAVKFRSGLYYEIYQEFINNLWKVPTRFLMPY